MPHFALLDDARRRNVAFAVSDEAVHAAEGTRRCASRTCTTSSRRRRTAFATLGASAIQNALVGVNPRDPLVCGSVLGVVALVSLLATIVPARRATRVDPMTALRVE